MIGATAAPNRRAARSRRAPRRERQTVPLPLAFRRFPSQRGVAPPRISAVVRVVSPCAARNSAKILGSSNCLSLYQPLPVPNRDHVRREQLDAAAALDDLRTSRECREATVGRAHAFTLRARTERRRGRVRRSRGLRLAPPCWTRTQRVPLRHTPMRARAVSARRLASTSCGARARRCTGRAGSAAAR
jgi:hypothetical protein